MLQDLQENTATGFPLRTKLISLASTSVRNAMIKAFTLRMINSTLLLAAAHHADLAGIPIPNFEILHHIPRPIDFSFIQNADIATNETPLRKQITTVIQKLFKQYHVTDTYDQRTLEDYLQLIASQTLQYAKDEIDFDQSDGNNPPHSNGGPSDGWNGPGWDGQPIGPSPLIDEDDEPQAEETKIAEGDFVGVS